MLLRFNDVPFLLIKENLDVIVLEKLALPKNEMTGLGNWKAILESPKKPIR